MWTKHFLESQGYNIGAAKIHQDNKSAIHLQNNGRSNNGRTRHMNIRYFRIKDYIDSGMVCIEHLGTNDLISDFFTKPLQGNDFVRHRKVILNLPN